ncbi:hypothetical protein GCM10010922_02350 [Microbacterium sorbitolivorans]|uniref:Uncharacterized protein n=1 Tax=Microbacterium sorbitolivorans TaxID=1867410 RepID=A0A367Y7J3_9MICO|nr:HGxxPAAW family protein [Microbacterium sorbitolivorans]RCK61590.1 hypothetical protein DTO57_02855 [Microbacterium sorbitolivorans]GGF30877.1 hypothetical protein GCM10010922_02350 [Microbacterium sorbitolivorans]
MTSNPIGDPGHGHSPAAWTAVLIMLIGITAGTVGLYIGQHVVVYISAAIVVLGPIVGFIVSKAGYGVNGPKFQPKGH